MKLYTCIDHDGHYPVGSASVIVANDKAQAKRLLDTQLKKKGLKPNKDSKYTLQEIPQNKANAVILVDGEY